MWSHPFVLVAPLNGQLAPLSFIRYWLSIQRPLNRVNRIRANHEPLRVKLQSTVQVVGHVLFEENEVEWTANVEIRNVKFLAVGDAGKAII